MLAIINVTAKTARDTGIHKYEVRINKEVIATFEHDRQYGAAAQCLRDAADAVERCRAKKQAALAASLLPLFWEK